MNKYGDCPFSVGLRAGRFIEPYITDAGSSVTFNFVAPHGIKLALKSITPHGRLSVQGLKASNNLTAHRVAIAQERIRGEPLIYATIVSQL